MDQKQAFCRTCGQPTLHGRTIGRARFGENFAYAALAVVTCGLFIPFWIGIIVYKASQDAKWRCQTCGAAN